MKEIIIQRLFDNGKQTTGQGVLFEVLATSINPVKSKEDLFIIEVRNNIKCGVDLVEDREILWYYNNGFNLEKTCFEINNAWG